MEILLFEVLKKTLTPRKSCLAFFQCNPQVPKACDVILECDFLCVCIHVEIS